MLEKLVIGKENREQNATPKRIVALFVVDFLSFFDARFPPWSRNLQSVYVGPQCFIVLLLFL